MTKKLPEVFRGIALTGQIKGLFDECDVTSVYMNKEQTKLFVQLSLKDIVHPQMLEVLAEKIKAFVDEEHLKVIIEERYDLTYDLAFSQLFEFYKPCLLHLIKRESPFAAAKISAIEPEVTEQGLVYQFDRFDYNYLKKYTIDHYITHVFQSKFGQNIQVTFREKEGREDIVEAFKATRKKEEAKLMDTLNLSAAAIAEKPKEIVAQKPEKGRKSLPDNLAIGRRGIGGIVTKIKELNGDFDSIIIEGFVLTRDMRITKSEKVLLIFDVTDYTDAITCKAFLKQEQYEEQCKPKMGKTMFVRIEGRVQFDTFSNELGIMINAMEIIDDFRTKKKDTSEMKRVELHCHTQMSDMDGMASAKSLVKRAKGWGHPAIAITDHGVAQAFPEAFHAIDHDDPFKIIYGVEAYIVDDLKAIVRNPKGQNLQSEYVVFDLETTGFYAGRDKITEIGAVKIVGGEVVDRYGTFINPERSIPLKVQQLTKIDMTMVKDAPTIEEELKNFLDFCGDSILVAHNADFDMGFIEHFAKAQNIAIKNTILDTLELARVFLPKMGSYKLGSLAKHFKVPLINAHRAVDDAEATAHVLLAMFEHMNQLNVHSIDGILRYAQNSDREVKKLRAAHAVILTKNLVGLRNLYELISESHLNYFFRQPKIPKSLFNKFREGLIIGTACEAGELYKAVLEDKPKEVIDRLCDFYDYFEIQPVLNNEFLIRDGAVEGLEGLRDVNRKIVALGEEHKKPVVATCDVHFLDPEDEVYRRILMAGKGFSDADNQAPLYLRTTDEMLKEFSYLGKEKAFEVVVKNTNLIANMIEKIDPVPPDKYPPIIEGSEEELRSICYDKAHEIYGPNLPEQVTERLERELKSIIGNGFAVMYIIAQKLVWKSVEDGYLVGSRGSVGSSFAATMSGITEVNPLAAHYICPQCYYVDFESDVVKAHSGNSGCDLPDADCPSCGHKLIKEGHDIPFETFLGFYGDKEPDIDLNFSGEYQAEAHKYTEVLFGEGHVFRAGTIGTMAEKTAFGFVKKYFDERGEKKRMAEINRLVQGCTGVRRTSGQHPGGIIVVPKSESIYQFTPIQHPANDQNTPIITTHFDYHSIDHNLLKLDILGHDDPTMIRMLEDLTGMDATSIPLDEPKVMSLFSGLDALGITPEDIGGTELGSLGIPEFGTDFVIQMLKDTKPQSFSDLCRISGLSHGTDVWLNNAQELIADGKANIKEIISTRDDIMTYLIFKGVEKGFAFKIMEGVRKGRGLTPDMEEAMKANGVPDWYIWSCKQIKYMFPKAHAVAYVMMAYRIAYFKVYHKEAYYATYFSIRAKDFNYETMCHGKHHLEEHLKMLKDKERRAKNREMDPETGAVTKFTNKEKDSIKDMKMVQEMYARGIEFEPIDLYEVDDKRHRIIDGKIMPSLSSLQGMGEKAAEALIQERDKGRFISIEDLQQRTKISKTVIELMKNNGILDGLQESNQLSLFEL